MLESWSGYSGAASASSALETRIAGLAALERLGDVGGYEAIERGLALQVALADSGRWPAGTVGTVVEADAQKALVEISGDHGHGLDFIALPHDALAAAGDHAERFAP